MKDHGFLSHWICTPDEAKTIINRHDKFWVSNCSCREKARRCQSSRLDVCLFFTSDSRGTGSNLREVDREFVDGLLAEARLKHLVSRPFSLKKDISKVQGICFCCTDCCTFFRNPRQDFTKGFYVEETNTRACIACGTCVDVCYFDARDIVDGELVDYKERCVGCGLCAGVCPMHCIDMLPRTKRNK